MRPTWSEASSACAARAARRGRRPRRRPEQVLEDEEHDSGEADGADAEALVTERDAGGQQGGGELRGEHGDEDRRQAASRSEMPSPAALSEPATRTKLRKFVTMKIANTSPANASAFSVPGVGSDTNRSTQGADRSGTWPRQRSSSRVRCQGRGGENRVDRCRDHADRDRRRRTEQRHRQDDARGTSPRCGLPRKSIVSTSLPIARTSRRKTSSMGDQSRACVVARATSPAATSMTPWIPEVSVRRPVTTLSLIGWPLAAL